MKDMIERTAWTAAEAFLGVLLANQAGFTNLATLKAAGIAGIAAGLTVVKVYAVQKRG